MKAKGANGALLKDKNNKGFTLLELIIVISIIAILSTIAMPLAYRSLCYWQMQTAAWRLVSDIRRVQQMAVSGEDRHRTILFDTANNLYRISKDAVIIAETRLPAGIVFEGVAFPQKKLAFNLNGVPTASGDIILRNRFGSYYYITVLPVTGRVKAGNTT